MTELGASLATVEEWKKKSSDLATHSDDYLLVAMTRGFEAMTAILLKDSNDKYIQSVLACLHFDRSRSLQLENDRNDSIRSLMHGFLESLQLILNEWIEERKQANGRQLDQVSSRRPTVPKEPKEEPIDSSRATNNHNQLFSLEIRKGKTIFEDDFRAVDVKVEVDDPEFAIENPINDRPSLPQVAHDGFHDNFFEDFSLPREDMEEPDCSVPPMKKYRSEPILSSTNRKRSISEDNHSEAASKEPQKQKLSDTEMECPECQFRTFSAMSWVNHLRLKHSTNPTLAGLALRCECGIECFSIHHSRSCEIANFTVIRKRDGPIRRFDDAKRTPRCVLCEKYPSTVTGYVSHLRMHHNSNLKANGIYLLCECGVKFERADMKAFTDHTSKCDGRDFALHKLNEE